MFLDMHGLIFYLSISPLAGSTRYLRKWTTSRPKRSARETTGSLGTLTLSHLYETFALACTALFPIAVRAIPRSANVIEANSFNWLIEHLRLGEFLQLTRMRPKNFRGYVACYRTTWVRYTCEIGRSCSESLKSESGRLLCQFMSVAIHCDLRTYFVKSFEWSCEFAQDTCIRGFCENALSFVALCGYGAFWCRLVWCLTQTRGCRSFLAPSVLLLDSSICTDTWLILPAVICSDKRLSHACLRTYLDKMNLRTAH